MNKVHRKPGAPFSWRLSCRADLVAAPVAWLPGEADASWTPASPVTCKSFALTVDPLQDGANLH
jgi:hypothetical protein